MTALAQSMTPVGWFFSARMLRRVEVAMADRRLTRLWRSTIVQPRKGGIPSPVSAHRSTIVLSHANWPSKVMAPASMPAVVTARSNGSAGN